MKSRLLLLPLACLFLAGGTSERPQLSVEPPQELRPFIEGNIGFALRLHAALAPKHGNLIFSPYSLSSALAVAQDGSRGPTEEQMTRVLGFPTNQAELRASLVRVRGELDRLDRGRQIDLQSATGLWAQKDYGFEKTFLARIRQHHAADIKFVDFTTSFGAVARSIDSWITRQTHGRIKGGMPSSGVDSSTRLAIVNTVYFKGGWASRFARNATTEQPFWTTASTSVPVSMMRQEHDFFYAETNDLQLVELPYGGRGLSMIVLLPKERDGLATIEAGLTAEHLKALSRAFTLCRVNLALPRFKMDSPLALTETLRRMGMTDAFDSARANFTGMSSRHPLFITSVDQASVIEVNEEGTVAASATRVSMGCSAAKEPPRRQFQADHPFLFFIRENHTGAILFVGRVVNPAQ